ncbi:MAG TPA: IPT/TIG domain-containing protein [Dehalococcoidales bacterium]|nr:IPT/TIG domain-containing protein [Dehalococcoidales bacterium]
MKFRKPIFLLAALITVMTAGMFFPRPVSAAPVITIFPRSGGPGTTVNIYGTNFLSYSGEKISVNFGDKFVDINNVIVPASGNFQASFQVPIDSLPGQFKVNISVSSSSIALDTFTVVVPTVHLNILGGTVGTKLIFNCIGFTADKTVKFTSEHDSTQLLGSQTTDSTGECSFDITLPENPQGTLMLIADDNNGHIISTDFEVIPSLSITPENISSGEPVNIYGSGFIPGNHITIILNGKIMSVPVVEKQGNFKSQFDMPAIQAGSYLITIIDEDGTKHWLIVSVTSKLTLSKTSGALGDSVILAGTGYQPESFITVMYDNTDWGTIVTNSSGAFSLQLTIPVSHSGPHVITASDGVNKNQISYTVESQPPDTPKLLTPNSLTKISYPLDFLWESVYDVSQPLVYTIGISRTKDFQKILFEKNGLDKSHFEIGQDEKLLPNRPGQFYYWHVRAIDGAGNIGKWSQPLAFHIDPEKSLSVIMKIIIGIAALAIIIAWGVILGSSLKRKKPPVT